MSEYSGPPVTPHDPSYQPEIVEGESRPRVLPRQDDAELDREDAAARQFTFLIGGIAALTLCALVLILWLF
ncbi:MAG: hypothetical protein HOU81_05775 [Hamadaea sp.]|uniref:hypothetical protein n=1 Tax=Hamadaea sp. TaxID=2024425 RepID=UPI0017C81186|nr:hypothetical protein [Hamadaea sp.]NUR70307.1 hypothetical protein [Hamadaea sp.]NUT21464.1 hypothetical protein [Hamadaea sp.]